MYTSNSPMLPTICCPRCKESLSDSKSSVLCSNKHTFKIDEGVLVLAPDFKIDEKYEWDKKIRDPEENKRLDETESPLAKKGSKKKAEDMINFIVKNVPQETSTILDIVTGRGLLIRKILPNIENTNVFLNDISTDVLVGTYKLIEPMIGTNKVCPIQSSATDLPFKDNSLTLITAYGPNNIHSPEEGFREIFRILKKDGLFIFSSSLIEKESPSYKYLLKEEGIFSNTMLIDKWKETMKDIGFKIVKEEVLFDGPVPKVPLDILPIEDGERNQNIGVILTIK